MIKMGLLEYYGKKGNFLSLLEYKPLLISTREKSSEFKGATGSLKGQTVVDLLDEDFFLLWDLRNLFQISPTYEACTKLQKDYRGMISCKYPSNQEWKQFL